MLVSLNILSLRFCKFRRLYRTQKNLRHKIFSEMSTRPVGVLSIISFFKIFIQSLS